MSEVQSQVPAVIQASSRDIEYKPFGSEDTLKLSVEIIAKYVAVPYFYDGKEIPPDPRECVKFMMLCRSQRLNPFAGDAFMIPFYDKREERVKYSLISSIAAMYKRAELHPEFDGIESGVICEDDEGERQLIEGDFAPKGQKVVGGWANVYFKKRTHPMKKRVSMDVYRKNFGVWLNDAPGMICKVAEAQALRDSFPTLLGGMMLREEAAMDVEAQVTALPEQRRPDFAQGLPPVDIDRVSAPRKLEKAAKTAQAASEPAGTSKDTPKTGNAAPAPSGEQQPPAKEPAKPAEKATEPEKAPETPQESPEDEEKALAEAGLAPEPKTEEPAPQGEPDPLMAAKAGDSDAVASVKLLCVKAGVSSTQLWGWLRSKKLAKENQKDLGELSTTKLDALCRTFTAKLPEIRSMPR